MERHRVMVIGSNVNTVQRVSNYCLKKNLEVFPYYGIPMMEDINLFAPHVIILCLLTPNDFPYQTLQPWILWSEQAVDEGVASVSSATELYTCLQKSLQTSN